MRFALARCRLLCTLILVGLAGNAEAQLLDVPSFVALDGDFDIHYGTPSVSAGNDASVLVVAGYYTRDSAKQQAIARRFAADGTPLGSQIRLDENEDASSARVAADGRGGFVAYWHRRPGLGLVARYLGSTGQPTTPIFDVAPLNAFNHTAVGLPSGAAFVWVTSGELLVRLYDLAGQPRGPAFVAAIIEFPTLIVPLGVAATSDGGFVIVWDDDTGFRGRRFDGDGTPLGTVETLVDDFDLVTVAANPLGGFAVVGTREVDTHARHSGIWARRFDASGAPLGASFLVDRVDPGIPVFPLAAYDPDGRLYVTWAYSSFVLLPRGRAYDPSGRPLRASFRLEEDAMGLATLTARPDGRFAEGRNENRDLLLRMRELCVPPHHTTCGDGTPTPPCERCDDGAANSDTTPDACRTTCATAACGDGVVDHNEACDDGNQHGCDGCDADCDVEVGFVCGDGTPSADCDEQCDDGPANDDTLPNACRTDCLDAHCGDGVLDAGETCDDGNRTSCDGCSDLCIPEPGLVCGDGIPELLCGEQCDDGNAIDGDGCTAPCRLERVPGGGSPATDCLVEWVVDNPTNTPRYDKVGAISGAHACVDGDPACDFDGAISGACTFHVRVCANNTNLATCDGEARLQSWSLRTPSASKAAKRPALAAVRAAFTTVPGAIIGPPLPDICSSTLAVPVAVRANAAGTRKPGVLILKSQATRYTGERDTDKLKLTCLP